MNQPNQQTKCGKHSNFFPAPHLPFEDQLKHLLTHAERDFYMTLCHLENRYGNKNGWFWHTDGKFKNRDGKILGFESFGFGQSTCKRARKKLVELKLIKTKREPGENGRWHGTLYCIRRQINPSTRDHSEPYSKTTMD